MKIKKIKLKNFKRFTDLSIDFGNDPKKIIALVGPNGCGKSSIFDAFEEKAKETRGGPRDEAYLFKGKYFKDVERAPYEQSKSVSIITDGDNVRFTQTSIYFRSSYRFTPRIDERRIENLPSVEVDELRPNTSSDIDARLKENYSRLIGGFFDDVYDQEITGRDWASKHIDKLNMMLEKVLDIKICSLGNPVKNQGCIYFEKGRSKNIPYNNLSAGEKEVVDLLLDFYIKTKFFTDTVFCIDEPELHLNTSIQRVLLIELEKLVPENCQLWVATHSIGFLRAMQEELREKVQVIDMNGYDFDNEIELKPIKMNRENWQRIFQTALEDITGLVSPKTIVYYEGSITRSLDEKIFNQIFSDYHDVLFVSATNKQEAIKYAGIALTILNKAFDGVEIKVLVDRDDDTHISIPNLSEVTVKKLGRREFENYLFDYEVVSSIFPHVDRFAYENIITDIINDNVKEKIKFICELLGETDKKKLKLKLASAIKPTTNVYNELKEIIFG